MEADPVEFSFPARMGSPTMYPGLPLNFTEFLLPAASRKRVSNVWDSGRAGSGDAGSTETETRSKLHLTFTIPAAPDQSTVYTT